MKKIFESLKRKIIIIESLVIILAFLLIFVFDMLGDQIHNITDTTDTPDLTLCSFENTIVEEFTALSDKLDRVSVCLIGIDENSVGILNTYITDLNGNLIADKHVSLDRMANGEYYEEIIAAKLNKNEEYNISFSLEDVSEPQNIFIALAADKYQDFNTKLYINNELVSGGILLVYDYLMPANFVSKIVAFILIIILSIMFSAVVVSSKDNKLGISDFEDGIIKYILNHLSCIIVGVSIILGVYVRWLFRDFESGDFVDFLSVWYGQIKELGGFKALSTQIGNYGIPYQFLIALISYLPIRGLYGYKIISCIFDFVTAFGIYSIVKHLSNKNGEIKEDNKYIEVLPSIAFAVSIFFPTAIFNSSCWAQCDAIYTSFIILSLDSLITGKETRAFVFYGLSFAFKLQAIFFFPVLILLYLKKRNFSIVNFFIVPLVVMIMCSPGYFYGRGLEAFFRIYSAQAGEYPYLSVGYPSIWTFFADATLHISEVAVLPFAIIIALIAVGVLLTEKIIYVGEIRGVDLIRTAFLITYTCVFFLPCMHERYGYLYATLGLILVLCDSHFILQFSLLLLVELLIYGRMLFNMASTFDHYAHLLNIILYITCVIYYVGCECNLRKGID